jgi:hypothetical protein
MATTFFEEQAMIWFIRILLLLGAAFCYGQSLRIWQRALAPEHLTPEGTQRPLKLLWLGSQAGRQYFTVEGLWLKARSLRFAWLGFACLVGLMVSWSFAAI